MDRGAWWATVHGVAELYRLNHAHIHANQAWWDVLGTHRSTREQTTQLIH